MCDLIFGSDNFRNEIVWKRTYAHNVATLANLVETKILFFSLPKAVPFIFNVQYENI